VIATKHPISVSSLSLLCTRIFTFALEQADEAVLLPRIVSFSPLWTTFVHILDQQRGLSKGKFRQILQKEWVSGVIGKKHNLPYWERFFLQRIVFTSLIQVAPDVLVNCAEVRQTG
jgi:hypothetical protein